MIKSMRYNQDGEIKLTEYMYKTFKSQWGWIFNLLMKKIKKV